MTDTATDDVSFEVRVTREEGYRFTVDFGPDAGDEGLQMDEPSPLGEGGGPNAVRVLAAAVGNCLSASLLYCLERGEARTGPVTATVRGSTARNHRGRLRVEELRVSLEVDPGDVDPKRLERCLEVFEDYCVVTGSVRSGIDVLVDIRITDVSGDRSPVEVPAEDVPAA